jgi:acetolactate synthase-1/2/3 large subunit
MMKGAQSLYQLLKGYGVKFLFGMDSPESLYQEVDREAIRPITVHDERTAAHMADGYARVSFRPGLCTAIHGPGVTNLITGLAEAQVSCIPVIGLVSAVDAHLVGKHSIQELDQVSLLKPITKWVSRVETPDRVPEMLRKAFRVATTGKPGPVVLNLTYHALETEIEKASSVDLHIEEEFRSVPGIRIAPDPERLSKLADLLLQARKPCIVAGGGVIQSQAWNELIRLGERLMVPVATTMLGKGAIPDTHYLSVGVMGTYTSGTTGRGRVANKVVAESDVVLLIGTQTDQVDTTDWTIPQPDTTILHIDIDPEEIGRNYPTAFGIVADAKIALQQLGQIIEDRIPKRRKESPRIRQIAKLLQEWRESIASEWHSSKTPINPQRVMKEVQTFIDSNTIVATDASYSSLWVLSHLDFAEPGRRYVGPRGLGIIGPGLPLALGAQLAAPDHRVICLTGDGGFGYSYPDLETAARYQIPVLVIVLNNQMLGFQKHYEETIYGKAIECAFLDTNFAQIAEALHCHGTRLSKPDEISTAIRTGLETRQPTVIDILIDPNVPGPISYFDSIR